MSGELGVVPPGSVCCLHIDHGTAKPLRLEVHHVWPRGAGGPDEAANRAITCPTGHTNVHALMWLLVHGQPMVGGSRTERAMAVEGVRRWTAAGRPGDIRAFNG